MGWYTLSGRNVYWSAGLLPSIPEEHFAYPRYPQQPIWFSVLPFLESFTVNLPTGVAPNRLVGYAHAAGFSEGIISGQDFVITFYLQKGQPFAFADAIIQNSIWEAWTGTSQIQLLPRPFTFIFQIRDEQLATKTTIVYPYAFVKNLSLSVDRSNGAIRVQATFTSSLTQILDTFRTPILTSYDTSSPFVLVREIVTHDLGNRQGIFLNLTVSNRLETVFPTYKPTQPFEYIRTAPRWFYLGTTIEVELGVLHPLVTNDSLIKILSLPPMDLTFVFDTRDPTANAFRRLLRLIQFRVTDFRQQYSFENMVVDEVRGSCRFIAWEAV